MRSEKGHSVLYPFLLKFAWAVFWSICFRRLDWNGKNNGLMNTDRENIKTTALANWYDISVVIIIVMCGDFFFEILPCLLLLWIRNVRFGFLTRIFYRAAYFCKRCSKIYIYITNWLFTWNTLLNPRLSLLTTTHLIFKKQSMLRCGT